MSAKDLTDFLCNVSSLVCSICNDPHHTKLVTTKCNSHLVCTACFASDKWDHTQCPVCRQTVASTDMGIKALQTLLDFVNSRYLCTYCLEYCDGQLPALGPEHRCPKVPCIGKNCTGFGAEHIRTCFRAQVALANNALETTPTNIIPLCNGKFKPDSAATVQEVEGRLARFLEGRAKTQGNPLVARTHDSKPPTTVKRRYGNKVSDDDFVSIA